MPLLRSYENQRNSPSYKHLAPPELNLFVCGESVCKAIHMTRNARSLTPVYRMRIKPTASIITACLY